MLNEAVNQPASTSNTSKLKLDILSEAFQYAGATAAATGVKFSDLTTSFTLMADAGVKSGSLIGTGTRQLISEVS